MRALPSCVLVLALTACSPGSGVDGPPSPGGATTPSGYEESRVRADLAAGFAGDRPGPEATEEGECFADEVLSSTTPEELREGGVLDEEYAVLASFPALERPLAVKVVAAQLECTDFVADSSRAGSYITKGRLAQRRYAACLRDDLSRDMIRAALLAAVMGEWEDDAVERLSAAQAGCAQRARR